MISTLLLVLALGAGDQAARGVATTPSAQELSAMVERVVRLAELQRQKLALVQELATERQQVGENHPNVGRLQAALADVESQLQREHLQSYQSDVAQLASQRAELEAQRSRLELSLGRNHPSIRAVETQLVSVKEQQRVAAVSALAGGLEAELRAAIGRSPGTVTPYLELAGLFAQAGRTDEASTLLSDALAVLKRSGGR